MSQYTYIAYGLTIRSIIEVPELPTGPRSSAADVRVELGEVPRRLEPVDYERHEPSDRGETYLIISRERVLLHVDGVGRYLVEAGSRVTIEPDANSIAHEVRVFLLGTCVGALLHQRGAFVLHASGIGTPQGCVLFAGNSGAGKSTLLAEFLRRGHRMLVDDVCAITADGDQITVTPSVPRTRVWSDAAAELNIDTTGLQRTLTNLAKFERQLPGQFWATAIYELTGPMGGEMVFSRLTPIEVLPTLISHTYRSMMLDALGVRRHHFDMASAIARSVPVTRVSRPEFGFTVAEIADHITTDLGLATPT